MNDQEIWEEFRKALDAYLAWVSQIIGGEIPFDTNQAVAQAEALANAHQRMIAQADTPARKTQVLMAEKHWYVPLKSITPTQISIWAGTP
jgi:hypothetical protein